MIGELTLNAELEIENSNGFCYWVQDANVVVEYDTFDQSWDLVCVEVEAYRAGKKEPDFRITASSTDLMDRAVWFAAKEYCNVWAEDRVRMACEDHQIECMARKADHYRESMKSL